jgi:hypothetical protein
MGGSGEGEPWAERWGVGEDGERGVVDDAGAGGSAGVLAAWAGVREVSGVRSGAEAVCGAVGGGAADGVRVLSALEIAD